MSERAPRPSAASMTRRHWLSSAATYSAGDGITDCRAASRISAVVVFDATLSVYRSMAIRRASTGAVGLSQPLANPRGCRRRTGGQITPLLPRQAFLGAAASRAPVLSPWNLSEGRVTASPPTATSACLAKPPGQASNLHAPRAMSHRSLPRALHLRRVASRPAETDSGLTGGCRAFLGSRRAKCR